MTSVPVGRRQDHRYGGGSRNRRRGRASELESCCLRFNEEVEGRTDLVRARHTRHSRCIRVFVPPRALALAALKKSGVLGGGITEECIGEPTAIMLYRLLLLLGQETGK